MTAVLEPRNAAYLERGYGSGLYYFCHSPQVASVVQPGNNNLRLTQWIVTERVSVQRLFTEFTVAGDTGSLFRLAVYGTGVDGYPAGSPVIDPGSISTGTGNAGTVATGGTPGVYEIVLGSPVTLGPGVYWAGGVLQGAPSSQPTMRAVGTWNGEAPLSIGGSLPSAGIVSVGHLFPGVSGALPVLSTVPAASGGSARIGFKVA